jgi:hypothetical protein
MSDSFVLKHGDTKTLRHGEKIKGILPGALVPLCLCVSKFKIMESQGYAIIPDTCSLPLFFQEFIFPNFK